MVSLSFLSRQSEKPVFFVLALLTLTSFLSVTPVQASMKITADQPGASYVDASNYVSPGKPQPVRITGNGSSKGVTITNTQPVPNLSVNTSLAGFSTQTTSSPIRNPQLAYDAPGNNIPKTQLPLDQLDQLTGFINRYNKSMPRYQASVLAESILEFSRYYKVDHRLVASMIAVESGYRPDAVSSAGAIGLGQLKPDTAQWLGVGNPFDPIENIGGLTRYLSWLMQKYNGSLDQAVSAYYQGPGFVDKQGVNEVCVPYLLKVNSALSYFW